MAKKNTNKKKTAKKEQPQPKEKKERKYVPPIVIYAGAPQNGAPLKDIKTGKLLPESSWNENTVQYFLDKEHTLPVKTKYLDTYFDGLWVFGKTRDGQTIVKLLGMPKEEKLELLDESLLDLNKSIDDTYEKFGLEKPDAIRADLPELGLNLNDLSFSSNNKLTHQQQTPDYSQVVDEWYAPYHLFNRVNYAQNFELHNPQLDAARRGEIMRWEADKHVRENYGAKAWGKVGLLTAAEVPAAIAAYYTAPWLLKTANTLMTPSTYTTALGFGQGVGTVANGIGTGLWVADAGYNIYKNPRDPWSYVNAALSVIPASRAGIKLKPGLDDVGTFIGKINPKAGQYYKDNLEIHDLLADGAIKYNPILNWNANKNLGRALGEIHEIRALGDAALSAIDALNVMPPEQFKFNVNYGKNEAEGLVQKFNRQREHNATDVVYNKEREAYKLKLREQIAQENPNFDANQIETTLRSLPYLEAILNHMETFRMKHPSQNDIEYAINTVNARTKNDNIFLTDYDPHNNPIIKSGMNNGSLPKSAILRTNNPNYSVYDPANPLTGGLLGNIPYNFGTTYNGRMPLFSRVDANGNVQWFVVDLDSPLNIKLNLNPDYTKSDVSFISQNSSIPTNYLDAILENIDYVNKLFPESHRGQITPFGSAVSVKNNNLIHASDDVDFIVTEGAMDAAFKNQWPTDKRYSTYHNRSTGEDLTDTYVYRHPNMAPYDKKGEVDLNVVYNARFRDSMGNIIKDPNKSAPTNRALELYLQFFPDEYYAAVKAARKKTSDPSDYIHYIEINKSPEELVEAASKFRQEKTIIDNINADAWVGDFNSRKIKHLTRTYAYLTLADPALMERALLMNARSYLGNGYRPAPVSLKLFLQGYEQNVEILRKLDCPKEFIPQIANDPLKTKNYFEYWWLLNTLSSRGTPGKDRIQLDPTGHYTADQGARNFNDYDEAMEYITRHWFGGSGGTASGTGLNSVTFGNSHHMGTGYATILANLNLKEGLNPLDIIKEVRYKLGMDDFELTPKMKLYIKDNFSHVFLGGPAHSGIRSIDELKTFKEFVNSSFSETIHTAKAMEKFSDDFGIIAHTLSNNNHTRVPPHTQGGGYGSSVYRGFFRNLDREGDIVKLNAHGLDASAPGSDSNRLVTLASLNLAATDKVTPPLKPVTKVKLPKYYGNYENNALKIVENRYLNLFNKRTNEAYDRFTANIDDMSTPSKSDWRINSYDRLSSLLLRPLSVYTYSTDNLRYDLILELLSKYTSRRDDAVSKLSSPEYLQAVVANGLKQGSSHYAAPIFGTVAGFFGTGANMLSDKREHYKNIAREALSLELLREAIELYKAWRVSRDRGDDQDTSVELYKRYTKFLKDNGLNDDVDHGIYYLYDELY